MVETSTGTSDVHLSFMGRTADGARSFWLPKKSGDYVIDCATGRKAAIELCDYMLANDNPVLLGSVMRDMVAGGEFGGVEAGFCSEIAIQLQS